MTARLPVPGSDNGAWGDILNEFLSVAHNGNGTLKQTALITGAEQAANKNQANGYAGLDANSKLQASQLPALSDTGVGDYYGVQISTLSIFDTNRTGVLWSTNTTSRGSSFTWDQNVNPNPVGVVTDGVYAISLTVNWNDANQSSYTYRFAQIYTSCLFHTEQQVAHTYDFDTVQSMNFTVYLQAGQYIGANVEQGSGTTLTPTVRMLVTKVA